MLGGAAQFCRGFFRFGVPPVETMVGSSPAGADTFQRFVVKNVAPSDQPVSVGYSMKPEKLRPGDAAMLRARAIGFSGQSRRRPRFAAGVALDHH